MDRRSDDDRRKVERFSYAPVREQLKQISMCLTFLTVLSTAGALYSVGRGFFSGSAIDVAFGVFMAFIFGSFSVLMFMYNSAIKAFLFNESLSNLEKVAERQALFWIVTSFLSLIWVMAFFIYVA